MMKLGKRPKKPKRGYPIGLILGFEPMKTLVWKVYKFKAELVQSIPLNRKFKNANKNHIYHFFESIIDVIVAYDSDDPGCKAARKLCRMRHFHKAEPYPMGKDLTEYHQSGGDVFEWLYQQVEV